MGSGHILVYAFDVLMQIYESLGYTDRDAARSIVEKNIYGLDIDDRAYQLAYFAVMMKACEYDGRFLIRGVKPHVYSIQESNDINRNQLKYFGAGLSDIEKNNALNQAEGLLDTFIDAKEYGSILNVENYDWELLERFVGEIEADGQMSMETIGIVETQGKLQRIIKIGSVMAKKYWVTCTNPPYMSSSKMDNTLLNYTKKYYSEARYDLSTIFMNKASQMTLLSGLISMINIPVWMFLSRYEKFRKNYFECRELVSMCHFGRGVFGSDFGTTAFMVINTRINQYIGNYKRLFDKQGAVDSIETKMQWFIDGKGQYYAKQSEYMSIPGAPIAYWASNKDIDLFLNKRLLKDVCTPRVGIITGDNEKFIKVWWEVNCNDIVTTVRSYDESCKTNKKWYPYNKGGAAREWYGNRELIVNFRRGGEDIEANAKEMGCFYFLGAQDVFFKQGITWTGLSISRNTYRFSPEGTLFDSNKGPMVFPKSEEQLLLLLALFNSPITQMFVEILNPSISLQAGDFEKLPIIEKIEYEDKKKILDLAQDCIDISKSDWDSFEISMDYQKHPLTAKKENTYISEAFADWEVCTKNRVGQIVRNEEVLNKTLIKAYSLQDELSSKVNCNNVSVRNADHSVDLKGLVSYAVGCMLGRYSLDVDGLAYAGGEWDASKYTSFQPDADNVLPITDARYMDDDIVDRFCEWLTVVYGAESLEENLDFIAKALGTKGTDSRDIIRNYFLNDFFKDHCQTYSVTGSGKRPIYWLFDSGKQNGFKALIYMHRYNADTIGRVRVSYLHPLQEKYENEVRSIDTMIDHMSDQRQIASEEKRREKLIKQIAEVKEYDERLDHLAQEHIDIDLDDGVKVNYEKIQTDRDGKVYQILAPIK